MVRSLTKPHSAARTPSLPKELSTAVRDRAPTAAGVEPSGRPSDRAKEQRRGTRRVIGGGRPRRERRSTDSARGVRSQAAINILFGCGNAALGLGRLGMPAGTPGNPGTLEQCRDLACPIGRFRPHEW